MTNQHELFQIALDAEMLNTAKATLQSAQMARAVGHMVHLYSQCEKDGIKLRKEMMKIRAKIVKDDIHSSMEEQFPNVLQKNR